MANILEKVFKLVIDFRNSGQQISKIIGGLVQLQKKFDAILDKIQQIGKDPSFQSMTAALKIYSTTVDAAAKAQSRQHTEGKKLTAQQQDANLKIDRLRRTYGNLILTQREHNKLQKSYITLCGAQKGSIEELQSRVSILNIAWKKLSATERNSAVGKQVTADLRAMRTEIRNTTVAAGDYSRNIGNYVSGIYTAITSKAAMMMTAMYTIRRVISAVFTPFQDLEYRMSMVRAVSGATADEFALLEQNARQLGASTEYTATEVAGLQLAYARMGFVPSQILEITSATLDLATATGEDLAKSADVVGTTLRGFNLAADQTKRVVDVMAKSFNSTSLQLDYFYESMKYVAPIASKANVSLEQTTAMLGILADRGIRGSLAGTALRRIFSQISSEGGDVNQRLEQLSKTGLTLGGAMDEVGRYAMTALAVLTDSKQGVDDLTVSLTSAEGSAKKAADTMRDNMRGDAKIMLSAIQEKLIAVGDLLAPLARGFMQFGTVAVTNIKAISGAVAAGAAIVLTYNGALKAKIILLQVSAAWQHVVAIKTILNTAAVSSNTAAIIRNNSSVMTASVLSKALAVVMLLCTGHFRAAAVAVKVFTVALASNPLGIFAVALASVISYFAFFRKEVDAASESQRRFNDESERFNKIQDEKRQRIDQLTKTIKDETETEYAKIAAYNELKQLAPDLTNKYTLEQLATLELAKATKVLNEQRDKENYNEQITKLNRLLEVHRLLTESEGARAKALLTEDERSRYDGDPINRVKSDINAYRNGIRQFEQAKQEAADKLKPLHTRILEADANVEHLEAAFAKAKQAYKIEREKWVRECGSGVSMPITFRMDVVRIDKQLSTERRKSASLKAQDKQVLASPNNDGDTKGGSEWSMSKDEEYNRRLLELKRKLHNDEIKSDSAYQQRVLELEIATLTKRISLHKDSASVLMKLKQELHDKEYKQRKDSEKNDESYASSRRATNERIEKYESDRVKAEIDALKSGIEKKFRLNDLSVEDAKQTAQKELAAEIDRLSKEQEAYASGSEEYATIEQEKAAIKEQIEQKMIDLTTAGAAARLAILRAATEEELKELAKNPLYAGEATAAASENKQIKAKGGEGSTDKALAEAYDDYNVAKNIINSGSGTEKEKRAANIQNELNLLQKKQQIYKDELSALRGLGLEDSSRYQQLLTSMDEIKAKAEQIGRGGGFWAKLFKLDKEGVKQLEQQAFDLASQIGQAMVDAQKQASQRRLKNEKKSLDAEYKIHSKMLDSKRDKGLISEKTYQSEMEKLEADKAAKEEAAERAAFEREKKLNIAQVIMDTALSIGKTFAMWGVPFAWPFAAIAAAQGAIQIGIIASQKYAKGGLLQLDKKTGIVQGRSHAQGGHQIYIDGTPIGEIEGGELLAIVNKQDTARIGALSEINSVHGKRFATGGLASPRGYTTTSASSPVPIGWAANQQQREFAHQQSKTIETIVNTIERQIDAINNRIDKLKVVLVTREVTEAQDLTKKIILRNKY